MAPHRDHGHAAAERRGVLATMISITGTSLPPSVPPASNCGWARLIAVDGLAFLRELLAA